MPKFICKYTVVIEAEDFDEAELFSVDLECDIRSSNKRVKECWGDPYLEEVE